MSMVGSAQPRTVRTARPVVRQQHVGGPHTTFGPAVDCSSLFKRDKSRIFVPVLDEKV